jgi:hypothetical protein
LLEAQRFEVQLKDSRIYELLEELGLSYQRAHRDYATADRAAQKDWVEAVKKNCNLSNPVSAPCFSMSLPFTIVRVYSMVGHNAILVQKSKVMNALATSSTDCYVLMRSRGEEFFRLSPGSKTEDISEYLAQLCLDSVELGYTKLCIILDNNPTHKQKMQAQLMASNESM